MFVEEAVVRRELAENFCYYNENYDSVQGSTPGRVGNAQGQAGAQLVMPTWQSCFCKEGDQGDVMCQCLVASAGRTGAGGCPLQGWYLQGLVSSVAQFLIPSLGTCRSGLLSVAPHLFCSQVPMTGHKPP